MSTSLKEDWNNLEGKSEKVGFVMYWLLSMLLIIPFISLVENSSFDNIYNLIGKGYFILAISGAAVFWVIVVAIIGRIFLPDKKWKKKWKKKKKQFKLKHSEELANLKSSELRHSLKAIELQKEIKEYEKKIKGEGR